MSLSLTRILIGQPPYRPLLDWTAGWEGRRDLRRGVDLENYATVLSDPLYGSAFLTSLRIAALGTLLTLIVGYPIALAMARAPRSFRPLLIALVILPFWTSFLIRVYAWIAILKADGFLNQLLLGLGLIGAPLDILDSEIAVQIGHRLLLPALHGAAALCRAGAAGSEPDRGGGGPRLHARARFLAGDVAAVAPGIIGGSVLVFIPAMGEFIIPDLLGGSDTLMVGRLVWTEFFSNRDWRWPRRSPSCCSRSWRARSSTASAAPRGRRPDYEEPVHRTNLASLVLGLAFLYLPIAILVGYSFNASRLVTVWGGFSTQWYAGPLAERAADAIGLDLAEGRDAVGERRDNRRHGAGARADTPRPLPGSGAACVPRLRAAGDAGDHHRPVAAAYLHLGGAGSRLLDGGDRARRLHHVLCRRGRAVAPRHLRPEPRGSRRRPRRDAAPGLPAGHAAG